MSANLFINLRQYRCMSKNFLFSKQNHWQDKNSCDKNGPRQRQQNFKL